MLLAALGLVTPWPANADVYKWVDERGVVNYGDAPPARASDARRLDLGAGTLSVVPGIPSEELDRLRERETQMRLQRLELEIEELRASQAAHASAPAAVPPEQRVFYSYPVNGNRRPWHPRAESPWPQWPAPPIAKPLPLGLKPLPGRGAHFPSVRPLPPRSRAPPPGRAPDTLFGR